MRLFWLSVFIFVFPSVSLAAVTINEVAWMGDGDSANHEWIELFNDGSAVDVTGWELSDGMKLSIPLEGTIRANAYAVLERTSDASASGSAFLIYTGALVNTGANLSLKRSDGSLEDQLVGGEDWENIGGDNTTKETAQYTNNGWITAPATPGVMNIQVEPEDDKNEEEKQVQVSGPLAKPANRPAEETVRLVLPGVTLALAIEAQTVGYVNQTIDFVVDPNGVGKTIANSLSYEWNFGDGNTREGKEVAHAYAYPGTYVVTVYGSYKRQQQVARHEITILPVTMSLTRNKKGDLQINNDSPYEIDISEYTIKAAKEFVFPERSILLPNQTITIPLSKIGYGDATVLDAQQTEVVSEYDMTITSDARAASDSQSLSIKNNFNTTSFSFSQSKEVEEEVLLATSSVKVDVVNEAYVQRGNSNIPEGTLPYLGLIGIITIGTLGVLVRPNS